MRKKTKFAVARLVLISVGTFIIFFCAVAQFSVPFTFYRYNSFAGAIKLGSEFKGGYYALFDVAEGEDLSNLDERLTNTAQKINSFLNERGTSEIAVTKEGNRIRVETNSFANYYNDLQIFGSPVTLTFSAAGYVKDLTKNIKKAYITYDRNQMTGEGRYGIMVELDDDGTAEYKDLTQKALDNSANKESAAVTVTLGEGALAAVENSIIIKKPVKDGKQFLTLQSQSNLNNAGKTALQLFAGSLDVHITLSEFDEYSPLFGEHAALILGIMGIVAAAGIIAYMAARYRAMGAMAVISFLLFIGLYLLLLFSFPIGQFTSVGLIGVIAGLILTAAMYLIIFARIEEEYKTGKTINAAIASGFSKALWSTLDIAIISALISVCIIPVGIALRNLGITIFMGAALALFCSQVVARILMKALVLINEDNKIYGLVREAGIAEIPDEEETKE